MLFDDLVFLPTLVYAHVKVRTKWIGTLEGQRVGPPKPSINKFALMTNWKPPWKGSKTHNLTLDSLIGQ